MKEVVEFLTQKNLIFKSFKEVLPKTLGSRKKVQLFVGVDLESYYSLVMRIEKKSRVLTKEVEAFFLLHEKMQIHIDSKIKKKYIIIDAPLCSKAKTLLKEQQWRVWHLDS